ncbi:MAG: RNA polymerase subunit sigma-24 [Acidimicrobiales bacterium]|nr:RNA polymerase subunit sigma-24 [Acidimicrobiales bacterium]
MDDVEVRNLVPRVIGILGRRGVDFATAEDAVQEALVSALDAWEREEPADPTAWMVTVAWRAYLDLARSDASRRQREVRYDSAPPLGEVPSTDDTLRLYFLCAHPDLTPSSAVALTLRAVGGLTTRQIAQAYLVPEATMAQRISRAKRTVSRAGLGAVGDVTTVMRVLYLVFNEGYSGDVDLAAESIRLTRQLASLVDEPEADGLLALMLLHHARRSSRTGGDGRVVVLADQDRTLWDTDLIAEGIQILGRALARERLGPYQAQAAIAALHADAQRFEDTDWVQIVEWYDELLKLADTPIVRLNRAVAVGEADGPLAGLAALADVADDVPRREAVAAHLHEKNGDLDLAASLYATAARNAPNLAERDHLVRQAARVNQLLRSTGGDGDGLQR